MRKYPEYKDSGDDWIGEIPVDWDKKKMTYCFRRIGSGTTPISGRPEYYEDGKNNFLQTGDLNDGDIIETSKKITDLALSDFSSLKFYPINSIVIAMYGATIGKMGILKVETTTNQACCVLSENNDVNEKFVFYWFISVRDHIISLSYGGGQPNINQDIIRNLRLQIPPITEQRQIVDFLDQKTTIIDDLIQKKQRKIELLKEHRTSIINQTVTKGLNPDVKMKDSGVEWIGDVPEHWMVSKFKYDSSTPVKYGLNISGDSYKEEGIRFIRITDLTEDGELIETDGKYLDENQVPKEFLLNKFDVLFCRSGHTVGKSYLHLKEGKYSSGGYLVRFNFRNQTESKFIFYIGKTDFYWDWIKLNSVISTIENVNGDKYQNFQYPKPPIPEQHQIVEYLDHKTQEIDTTITLENKKIDLLKEYRQSLISEVVTGKIDVRKN